MDETEVQPQPGNPIAQMVAHYRNTGLNKIEVPEWANDDGEPLEIYYTPMTLAETKRIYSRSVGTDDVVVLADTLIQKALFSDGTKMFRELHRKTILKEVDAEVLMRVVRHISAATMEEDLGND